MEIKFIGNKPEKTIYAYAVKENNDTNTIKFVLDHVQEGINLEDFEAFAKIRGANFVDKVPLLAEYEGGEKIKYCLDLKRKHTSSRGLDIQLQFEYFTLDKNVLVWQTEIFTMVLSDTIPADEEIANKYPAILQDHERRISEEEEKSVVFADQIQNHEGRMTNVENHNEVQDAEITALDEKISRALAGVFHYKGSVATFNDLPSVGQEVGDTYNVLDTGDNYTWSGSGWDKLSGIVDLSHYYTIEETDTLLGEKADKEELVYIANGLFNVINASDIVNNTLTQEQYDLITNGKPTLIKGGSRILLIGTLSNNGQNYSGLSLSISSTTGGQVSTFQPYNINVSTKFISYQTLRFQINQSANTISILDNVNLKGKVLPNYPADNTKNYTLKLIAGTLTWVEDN